MDLQEYIAYRREGGTSSLLAWEFGGIQNWEQASTPGQVGKRLVEAWTQEPLSPRWAALTNNIAHWAFGVQWGLPYGIVVGSKDPIPFWPGLPFGASVWLFGYAVLPLGHFYKPIWAYDARTLAKDLGSHLVYGAATGITFRLLTRR
jgi:hypothetical protein